LALGRPINNDLNFLAIFYPGFWYVSGETGLFQHPHVFRERHSHKKSGLQIRRLTAAVPDGFFERLWNRCECSNSFSPQPRKKAELKFSR
jgi:hypothetical protein